MINSCIKTYNNSFENWCFLCRKHPGTVCLFIHLRQVVAWSTSFASFTPLSKEILKIFKYWCVETVFRVWRPINLMQKEFVQYVFFTIIMKGLSYLHFNSKNTFFLSVILMKTSIIFKKLRTKFFYCNIKIGLFTCSALNLFANLWRLIRIICILLKVFIYYDLFYIDNLLWRTCSMHSKFCSI